MTHKFVKTVLFVTILLGLSACGQSQTATKHSDTNHTTQQAKKQSTKLAASKASRRSKASSTSVANAKKESAIAASQSQSIQASQIASSQAASVSASQAQQASQKKAQATAQSSSSTPTTLAEFVKQYGCSPAAYKMQHDGMSEQQALQATPDDMETSGEIQTEHMMSSQGQ